MFLMIGSNRGGKKVNLAVNERSFFLFSLSFTWLKLLFLDFVLLSNCFMDKWTADVIYVKYIDRNQRFYMQFWKKNNQLIREEKIIISRFKWWPLVNLQLYENVHYKINPHVPSKYLRKWFVREKRPIRIAIKM